jgi:hypothetical protein
MCARGGRHGAVVLAPSALLLETEHHADHEHG